MDEITILLFCVVFALAVVFSILSIDLETGDWAKSLKTFLGTICWFSFAELILVLAPTSMYVLSYLFMGFGFIFLALGFGYAIQSMEAKRDKKEKEGEWELLSE